MVVSLGRLECGFLLGSPDKEMHISPYTTASCNFRQTFEVPDICIMCTGFLATGNSCLTLPRLNCNLTLVLLGSCGRKDRLFLSFSSPVMLDLFPALRKKSSGCEVKTLALLLRRKTLGAGCANPLTSCWTTSTKSTTILPWHPQPPFHSEVTRMDPLILPCLSHCTSMICVEKPFQDIVAKQNSRRTTATLISATLYTISWDW